MGKIPDVGVNNLNEVTWNTPASRLRIYAPRKTQSTEGLIYETLPLTICNLFRFKREKRHVIYLVHLQVTRDGISLIVKPVYLVFFHFQNCKHLQHRIGEKWESLLHKKTQGNSFFSKLNKKVSIFYIILINYHCFLSKFFFINSYSLSSTLSKGIISMKFPHSV